MLADGVDFDRRPEAADGVLTPDGVAFLAELHRRFEPARRKLLDRRRLARERRLAGVPLDFRHDTAEVRVGDWQVAPAPQDLERRWVEITGPPDAKTVINALNSGATGFMADFEDATTPTWENLLNGQANLSLAIAGTLEHRNPDGRSYSIGRSPATLLVRPRGLHLPERHFAVDGVAMAGALFDFGLYFQRNAAALIAQGSGPYFYLPKLESSEEARLWNDVFSFAQDALGIPQGTIKATVLIETLPAAFEMDEILHELRAHSGGLNAGRWDYLFSVIKTFPASPAFVLPDRAQITMTVPFMRAYTELLVATCHRRRAHAIGGMAAVIPSRRDPEANARAMAQVRADKEREVADGFDGSWVAHPDLVPLALEVFDAGMDGRDNQLGRLREDVTASASALLDVTVPGGAITLAGVRANISVGIQYLASWLRGSAAIGINNLMEDVATAEIARAQIWQWIRHACSVDGEPLSRGRVIAIGEAELEALSNSLGEEVFAEGRFREGWELFQEVALGEVVEFLTIPAYGRLP